MSVLNEVEYNSENPAWVYPINSNPNISGYKEYLRNPANNNTGTNLDMDVNGSNNNVLFVVDADPQKKLNIELVTLFMYDGSIDVDLFGGVSTGDNTFDLYLERDGSPVLYLIKDAFTLLDLVEQSGVIRPFPFDDNFRASQLARGIKIYYQQNGLFLNAGSTDRLVAVVKENITGLNRFRGLVEGTLIDP